MADPKTGRLDNGAPPGVDSRAFEEARKKIAAGTKSPGRYSEAVKAVALAALRANGGNVKRTVRVLAEIDMKVPRETLRDWSHDEEKAAPEELRAAANEALASVFEQATMKFAVLLASDEVVAHMAANAPRDLAISAKVTIDAMQLLRGKPTTITSGDPYAQLLRKAADANKPPEDASTPTPE